MKKPNVLFVEADVLVRQSISEYLRECGYRVLEAVDTDEAKELILKAGLSVDVVFVDVESGGALDGFGLAKWINRHSANTKVLLARTPQKVAKGAAELCEEGPLLSKPYHEQLLLDQIKNLLAAQDSKKNAKPKPRRPD